MTIEIVAQAAAARATTAAEPLVVESAKPRVEKPRVEKTRVEMAVAHRGTTVRTIAENLAVARQAVILAVISVEVRVEAHLVM